MNRADTARLLTMIAACDRRTIGDADVAAWHAILGDVSFDDASIVVREHYGSETAWMMPAHIVDGVRRIRSDRLAGLDALLPDADPDDVAGWLAAYRQQIADVASGRREVPPPSAVGHAGVHPSVREAIEAAMPRPEQAARARNEAARQAEEAERARQMAALVELPDDDEASDA